MRPFLVILLVLLLTLPINGDSDMGGRIKHFIVLMLENRSFDHMLGFLKTLNSRIRGCLPNEDLCFNHINPQDPKSPTVTVNDNAVYVQVDPHHTISWTTEQVYGLPKGTTPTTDSVPTMDGFISSYTDSMNGSLAKASTIMNCFSPEHLPVLANLSMEYGLFDTWFSSVPGPTMVNRAYAASATSNGMGTNDFEVIAKGMPQKTMFKQLLDMGLDYKVYFQDIPHVLMFKDMRREEARARYHYLPDFFEDVTRGDLPHFSWIEPAYLNSDEQMSTDQHPDHDVSLGEQLIKNIYEALRSSPVWESSALLITYDEHGGFFDHMPPPTGVPNPDGKNATDDPFDFTRLGVRVPAVVISPWIKKGSVFHSPVPRAPPSSSSTAPPQFEHASIISTVVHNLFSPAEGFPAPEYLNERDKWAGTFEDIFEEDSKIRRNCPLTVPDVYQSDMSKPQDGSMFLSELQQEIVALMAGVGNDRTLVHNDVSMWTEREAATYCRRIMDEFLATDNEDLPVP